MGFILPQTQLKNRAGFELNDMVHSNMIPAELFDKSRITSRGTTVYDINGQPLFNRVPIQRGRKHIGYMDLAINSDLGVSVISVSHGYEWNSRKIILEAKKHANRILRGKKYNKIRFVTYSFPKIAIQFLKNNDELLLLELNSWEKVPQKTEIENKEAQTNFNRWSLLDSIPNRKKASNTKKFDILNVKKNDFLKKISRRKIKLDRIDRELFKVKIKDFVVLHPIYYIKELHYSPINTDHHICYELRGQLTNVWCVAASVQMILDFYRYHYTQDKIADELDLGTRSHPNGLPYARCGDVVTVLENLTLNALNAHMNSSPNWNEFRDEINNNRPLISFIPGHSRTIAGYRQGQLLLGNNYKGLLVYDPWPPSTTGEPNNGGVITSWENFDMQTYIKTFRANLNTA